ncbi:MAG: hypothetical protein ACI4O7_12320 [Aristaeellaceae bacterium]
MLKRILSLLAALCLLCSAALAEDMPAEPTDAITLDNAPTAMAALNDHLYIAAYTSMGNGLLRQTEEGWLSVLDFGALNSEISMLTVHDGTLYMLLRSYISDVDASPYAVYTAREDDSGNLAAPVKALDVDLGLDEDCWPQFYGMACDGEYLYVLLFDYETTMDWGNNQLIKVSLADGSFTRLTQDYLCGLAMTPEGLAGLYRNWAEYENALSLVLVDRDTAAFTTLTTLETSNASGLTWDDTTGYLYTTSGTELLRYRSGMTAPELCGYLLPGASADTCAVSQGQFLCGIWAGDGDYIAATSIDPARLPTRTLRLVNYGDSDILYAFCKAHPEIAVTEPDSYAYTADAISQEMLSGGSGADVYSMYLPNGAFTALRDKGYVADLSASQTLTDFANRMYPQFCRMLYNSEGKLIAFPLQVQASCMGYFPAALEKVGLTVDDLPTSIEGLMDFILLWQEDYAGEYPEIRLFGDYVYNLDQHVFSLIFNQRVVDCAAAGEPLTFNTPEMRALLTQWEQLRSTLQELSQEADDSLGVVYYSDTTEANQLFTTYADPLPQRYGHDPRWDGVAMPLSLTGGSEACISTNMAVSFVNPNSPNLDLAVMWLEFYAEHMYLDKQIALLPDVNEPMEYMYYQQNLKSIQESIASMEAALAEADEADKAMYEENLAWMREDLAETESRRWAVSEEDIAAYRALAPRLIIADSADFLSTSTDGANEASRLIQRYMDGQIGAEQFIRELDRIIQMMQMESY